MQNKLELHWIESVSSKGKTYDYIEFIFVDKDGEPITLTKDFDMNDIKRYVLKNLGIKKETR